MNESLEFTVHWPSFVKGALTTLILLWLLYKTVKL